MVSKKIDNFILETFIWRGEPLLLIYSVLQYINYSKIFTNKPNSFSSNWKYILLVKTSLDNS